MINFTNVDKVYSDDEKTLDNINLSIKQGEFVFVIGSSGAGKSSFLKLLTREEKLTKGKLTVLGIDVTRVKSSKLHFYKRKLGIVFQDFKLLENKTVYENIEIILRACGENPKEIREKVIKVLKSVGIEHKHNKYPSELSGGECQRVGIARAIVNKPSIIIADECTGNLDRDNSINILNILSQINRDGVTVIMATHDMEMISRYPNRVIKLEGGKIVLDTSKGGSDV
ncbi:MAG: cell division ATP-binding protein FtsE [Peptostreptococcaceae bacterium]